MEKQPATADENDWFSSSLPRIVQYLLLFVLGAIFVYMYVLFFYSYCVNLLMRGAGKLLKPVLFILVGHYLVFGLLRHFYLAAWTPTNAPIPEDIAHASASSQSTSLDGPVDRQGPTGAGATVPLWCAKCRSFVHRDAEHCKICRQCVRDIHHHCLLIGTCVGAHNHRPFLKFLIFLLLATGFMVSCTLRPATDPEQPWNLVIIQLFAIAIVLFLVPCGYVSFHVHTLVQEQQEDDQWHSQLVVPSRPPPDQVSAKDSLSHSAPHPAVAVSAAYAHEQSLYTQYLRVLRKHMGRPRTWLSAFE